MTNVGLLGEILVQAKLVENGWHPLPLNAAQVACNADLIAIDRLRRVAIQVKTTNGKEHSHAHAVQLGYATGYLSGGKSFFNSKESPLVADVIVAINCAGADSRFVVLPVAFAETLCRFAADYWDRVPKRDGEGRSTSFPIYLPLRRITQAQAHVAQGERMQRNVLAFENAWHVLAEPIDKLHDRAQWPLLP